LLNEEPGDGNGVMSRLLRDAATIRGINKNLSRRKGIWKIIPATK